MKTLAQLAREAGMECDGDAWFTPGRSESEFDVTTASLACFRAACRAEALEEAAKECIALGKEHPAHIESPVQLVAKWCAAAIREMK